MKFLLLVFISLCVSCSQKYVPDYKLQFDPKYRTVFDAVSKPLYLEFFSQELDSTILLKRASLDSFIHNSKGWFINKAPYKYVECKYYFTDSSIRDTLSVFIDKEGLSEVNTFNIGGETCWLMTDSLSSLNKGLKNFVQNKFQNVYSFKMGSDRSRNCYVADFISIFYLNSEYGIIAILDKDGMYWYNRNIFNL